MKLTKLKHIKEAMREGKKERERLTKKYFQGLQYQFKGWYKKDKLTPTPPTKEIQNEPN